MIFFTATFLFFNNDVICNSSNNTNINNNNINIHYNK